MPFPHLGLGKITDVLNNFFKSVLYAWNVRWFHHWHVIMVCISRGVAAYHHAWLHAEHFYVDGIIDILLYLKYDYI